ncbi:hypothetical protein SUGI_1004690 [Cryptomeria japonica]|uniref:uncharacterized protein LOC131064698 n=1 Tax=Cryptomeria japonica TaxID=3369 RepID=UPI0024148C56|nr:uncharacterized protein LOC131064698 [Cryptomeria japonica]GLJ47579.1 hypothetical protein SUGI_1004690 [Cryptomeria japonica]
MGNTSCCCSCSSSHEDYQNFISKIVVVEEMSHVDDLISYIDQLLNAIDEGRQVPKMAQVSFINSGGSLLEKVLQRSNGHICKRDIMPKLNRETRKFAIDVTNQAAHIQWLGITLSVVGFVLERIEQVSSNRKECIELLGYMCNLAKYIKQLNEDLPREKMNGVLEFIVNGCLMCISQMKSNALSKFFAAPVAAEDLRKFQAELGHEYQELSLEAIIAVLNRIPVVLPPSQGISPQAVGIEEATNHVIGLLNMKGGSVGAVVIYGQGGTGKTTLATAVFSKPHKLQTLQNCYGTKLFRGRS